MKLKDYIILSPLLICLIIGLYLGISFSSGGEWISRVLSAFVGLVIGGKVGFLISELLDLFFGDDNISSANKEQPKEDTEEKRKKEEKRKAFEDFYNHLKSFEETRKEYYKILECNPNEDFEIIKRNYRRLAKEFHPDSLGSNASESIKQMAKEKAQQINGAFDSIKKERGIK